MVDGNAVPAVHIHDVPDDASMANDEAPMANKSEPITNGTENTQVSPFVTILHHFQLTLCSLAINQFFLFTLFHNQETYCMGLNFFLRQSEIISYKIKFSHTFPFCCRGGVSLILNVLFLVP